MVAAQLKEHAGISNGAAIDIHGAGCQIAT
jgi:hypothetical protein